MGSQTRKRRPGPAYRGGGTQRPGDLEQVVVDLRNRWWSSLPACTVYIASFCRFIASTDLGVLVEYCTHSNEPGIHLVPLCAVYDKTFVWLIK